MQNQSESTFKIQITALKIANKRGNKVFFVQTLAHYSGDNRGKSKCVLKCKKTGRNKLTPAEYMCVVRPGEPYKNLIKDLKGPRGTKW